MNRRGFIGSILALGVAPAIVRADSLMRIVPRDLTIIIRMDATEFIEQLTFTTEQIARYFGVPRWMNGMVYQGPVVEPGIWPTSAGAIDIAKSIAYNQRHNPIPPRRE